MSKEIIINSSKLNDKGTKDEALPAVHMENLRKKSDNLTGTPVFDDSDDFALNNI
ncbi:MAG: hypothetical protein LBF59_10435 [Prevotellaceae bacterium]|jgi:hypothetical protein|nr:hypothetical protein [Prevotellaceae bacterium]